MAVPNQGSDQAVVETYATAAAMLQQHQIFNPLGHSGNSQKGMFFYPECSPLPGPTFMFPALHFLPLEACKVDLLSGTFFNRECSTVLEFS